MFVQHRPVTSFKSERWFGMTRGDEAFGARAHSYDDAVRMVSDSLDVDRQDWIQEIPLVAHLRGPAQEKDLNSRYPDLTVVRFIPGTIDIVPVRESEIIPMDYEKMEEGLMRARNCGWWLGELLVSLEVDRQPEYFGEVLHREGRRYPETGHVRDMLAI